MVRSMRALLMLDAVRFFASQPFSMHSANCRSSPRNRLSFIATASSFNAWSAEMESASWVVINLRCSSMMRADSRDSPV